MIDIRKRSIYTGFAEKIDLTRELKTQIHKSKRPVHALAFKQFRLNELLRAAAVFVSARVDFDLVADFYESRNH